MGIHTVVAELLRYCSNHDEHRGSSAMVVMSNVGEVPMTRS